MTLLNPDTVMLFSPFGCIYQPTSPCPTLSAHTKPISHGHCWKLVTSQIVCNIHAIAFKCYMTGYADIGSLS